MLKELRIQNLILIENETVTFSEGFNVISGETGAGKSALTTALSLVLGARSDTKLLRKGAEKGAVEAVFQAPVASILAEAGIEHSEEEDLLIRREITSSGRSRSFVNAQPAHSALLRQLAPHLVDLVSQHANQQLRNIEAHRSLLDLFGAVSLGKFQQAWSEELRVHAELQDLIQREAEYTRERDRLHHEIEEIQAVSPEEGEDDALFEEYSALTEAQEELGRLLGVNEALGHSLNTLQGQKERLVEVADQENIDLFKQVITELEEIAYSLRTRQSELECNPRRLVEVDQRLSLITRLKRKYGQEVSEIQEYLERAMDRCQFLDNLELHREDLEHAHKEALATTQLCAQELTEQRRVAAKKLGKAITDQLHGLNLAQARFDVELRPCARSSCGDEQVEYMLAPNTGEDAVSVASKVSGGELARVMIALKRVLAGKEKVGTLIFDEVDANIGGETATLIGERMHEMGAERQVICITHFAQVAHFAERHMQIYKEQVDGRTRSRVKVLKPLDRSKEIARMLGKVPATA